MTHYPLVTHTAAEDVLAWRHGQPVSVAVFLADARSLAAKLPAGQHVLNICRDRYHFAVGFAAAILAGKVSLLPPTHTPDMVQQLQSFAPDVFCLHDLETCTIALPAMRYPDGHALPQVAHDVPQIDASQLVARVFTSGSTAAPVPHAKYWGSLVQNVQAEAQRLQLTPGHVLLGTVPPQHMYGFESTLLLAWQSANALQAAQPFYPADIVEQLAMVPGPRVLVTTPLHLRLLLDAELPIPDLELLLSATAPLSPALATRAETTLSAPLLEIYGSTETGQVATRRPSTSLAWQLLPGVRLLQRNGVTLACDGHLLEETALNDIIETLPDGEFLLHGRSQDLVNIAGKRTSLANLDYHLNAIAGVIDAAFYMPDEHADQQVTRLAACVVAPGMDSASILAALRSRIDAVFLPRPLLLVQALPRNSTGKLPRHTLGQLITEAGKPQLETLP